MSNDGKNSPVEMTASEAVKATVASYEADVAKYKKRWPSDDAYAESSLKGWLELGRWNSEEGICLLFGINPDGAKINWDGYLNFDDVWVSRTKIDNVNFLNEDGYFYVVPRSPGDKLRNDEDVKYKNYRISQVEPGLARAWKLLERGRPIGFNFRPIGFINWAKENDIEIPWLDWALENTLVELKLEDPCIPEEEKVNPSTPVQLGTNEKNTLLVIIGALLNELKIDPNEDGVATSVVHMVEQYGVKIDPKTVRNKLKLIKDARERRS